LHLFYFHLQNPDLRPATALRSSSVFGFIILFNQRKKQEESSIIYLCELLANRSSTPTTSMFFFKFSVLNNDSIRYFSSIRLKYELWFHFVFYV